MAKSAKSAKSERQKLIDDAMKKQKGAEKRRGYAIVAVCVGVALLIIGAAAYRPVMNWFDQRQYDDLNVSAIGAPASVCSEITMEPANGVQDHVPPDTQIDYPTSPPAFGQHYDTPAPIDRRFYSQGDRPDLGTLVHNLEHGYTILWYDETAAADDETMEQIEAIANKFDGDDSNFRLKFKAAPWTSEDGEPFPDGQSIAMTHWTAGDEGGQGIFQYCSEPSGEALDSFMTEYPYLDSPEPNAG